MKLSNEEKQLVINFRAEAARKLALQEEQNKTLEKRKEGEQGALEEYRRKALYKKNRAEKIALIEDVLRLYLNGESIRDIKKTYDLADGTAILTKEIKILAMRMIVLLVRWNLISIYKNTEISYFSLIQDFQNNKQFWLSCLDQYQFVKKDHENESTAGSVIEITRMTIVESGEREYYLRGNGLSSSILEADDISIDSLDLTYRATQCLVKCGATTLHQLLKFTSNDLLKSPNLGRKSLNEIKEKIAELGYRLKD